MADKTPNQETLMTIADLTALAQNIKAEENRIWKLEAISWDATQAMMRATGSSTPQEAVYATAKARVMKAAK